MTKRFALTDTLPNPYFTIDSGGAVTVHSGQRHNGRSMVEIWRDGQILCRVFAKSIQVVEEPTHHTGRFGRINSD